jgi:hypothetical protein
MLFQEYRPRQRVFVFVAEPLDPRAAARSSNLTRILRGSRPIV